MGTTRWAALLAVGVVVATLVVSCASNGTQVATRDPASSGAVGAPGSPPDSPPAGEAERVCQDALRGAVLLNSAPATVARFRAYQYGGPTPTAPLADVFPDLAADTPGAWCATTDAPQSTHWWAAVNGRRAASLITINGPGEGVARSSVQGPPQIP